VDSRLANIKNDEFYPSTPYILNIRTIIFTIQQMHKYSWGCIVYNRPQYAVRRLYGEMIAIFCENQSFCTEFHYHLHVFLL